MENFERKKLKISQKTIDFLRKAYYNVHIGQVNRLRKLAERAAGIFPLCIIPRDNAQSKAWLRSVFPRRKLLRR